AVTPLKSGGREVDRAAIPEYVTFLAEAGLDGVMVTGTAGEGLLLSGAERRQVVEDFIAASPPGFRTLVQCGAQTTAESTGLARHAARAGAAGVLAICPSYFPLDATAQQAFLGAVAAACAPVSFGGYEFAPASLARALAAAIDRFARKAAVKAILRPRGVPIELDVRPPLRSPTPHEHRALINGLDQELDAGWRGPRPCARSHEERVSELPL